MTHPTPEAIRAARDAAGLTQKEAAALLYVSKRSFEQWEQGLRRMPPGLFELFNLKSQLPRAKESK